MFPPVINAFYVFIYLLCIGHIYTYMHIGHLALTATLKAVSYLGNLFILLTCLCLVYLQIGWLQPYLGVNRVLISI